MARSRDLTEVSRERSRRRFGSYRDACRRRDLLRLRLRSLVWRVRSRSAIESRRLESRERLAPLFKKLGSFGSLALLAGIEVAGFRPFSIASASSKSNSRFCRAFAASSSPSFKSICKAASSSDFSSTGGAGVGSFDVEDFSRFGSRLRGERPRSERYAGERSR